jgi:serine protease Do
MNPASARAQVSIPDEIVTTRRNAIVRAVEKASGAVVSINTHRYKEYPRYRDPFWGDAFFGGPSIVRERIPGVGSGFIIREDGYILTNSHVVENAREISVTFPDGRKFEVTDTVNNVLMDRQNDLAVVHIDAKGLHVPPLGSSEEAIIGEWAIAIGNPFGLTITDPKPTVTVGVVSAVDRNFRPEEDGRIYKGMIQTDASINPGNSGGPLINSLGEVIGVNTFIFTQSGGSLGIGFAIPIEHALEVADRLIEGGSPEFWTGLVIHNNNRRIARAMGLATASGALITSVEEGSPAQKAGLTPGDVIVMINEAIINSADEVVELFREGRVGEVYALRVLQGRIVFNARLVLERDPNS